jgi:hypothetical protein
LPYLGYTTADDPVYQNTRRFVLSEANPYFAAGKYARGVGSPHTPPGYVWSMSLIIQALTSQDEEEIREILQVLTRTDAETGLMHESFDPDNPTTFTRAWFAWANSLFAELVAGWCEERRSGDRIERDSPRGDYAD